MLWASSTTKQETNNATKPIMKEVTINTGGAGCDWIYDALASTLGNKIAELKGAPRCMRDDNLVDIINIARTMREVCEARDNAKTI